MMGFSVDLPNIKVFVRKSFLNKDSDGLEEAYLLSVTNIPNRPLFFNVLLESGAIYSRLPISALSCDRFNPLGEPEFELEDLQPYSCLDGSICVVSNSLLKDSDIVCRISDKKDVPGNYLFTIDVMGQGLAEDPEQYKSFNIAVLYNGQIVALPNNLMYITNDYFTKNVGWPNHIRRNTKYWTGCS
jgi:hypothetical protein